jgi:hypothetical protein
MDMANPDGRTIRRVLLEVIDEYAQIGSYSLYSGQVLDKAAQKLELKHNVEAEQALLTLFYDLFRTGHLAWGHDLSFSDPPMCHMTAQGRQTLQHLSRDPANPDGYLAHLAKQGSPNAIARSYLHCFKATAVMVGAAAESLILELREVLVTRINALGHSPSKELGDWRIKRVLNALKKELDNQKSSMPSKLAEGFESYWPAFTQQIRAARNDAGHPSSIGI